MLTLTVDVSSLRLGDTITGPITGVLETETGEPVDVDDIVMGADLISPDPTAEIIPLIVTEGAEPSQGDVSFMLSDVGFDTPGVWQIQMTVASSAGNVRPAPAPIVVEDVNGWVSIDQARREWEGAPDDDVMLWRLLDVAKTQVLAYGEPLADGVPVPQTYVQAQLMQTRNLWNAAKTDPQSQGIGDDGFLYRPYPLDSTIRRIIRPKTGVPGLW